VTIYNEYRSKPDRFLAPGINSFPRNNPLLFFAFVIGVSIPSSKIPFEFTSIKVSPAI
jgi:hypothetical protein